MMKRFKKFFKSIFEISESELEESWFGPNGMFIEPSKIQLISIDNLRLRIVTRDEYLLQHPHLNKKAVNEEFNRVADGYNFIFRTETNNYYSIDYVNKLLEK